jgi:hypothetical protein
MRPGQWRTSTRRQWRKAKPGSITSTSAAGRPPRYYLRQSHTDTNAGHRDCRTMSARHAIAPCAALLVLAMPFAADPAATRDIDGWQKLRFGMSFEQALAAHPGAKPFKHFCGGNQDFFVPPEEHCEQVWIENAQAAGLTWNAVAKFSRSRELFEVELTLRDRSRANFDTFNSLLASLNNSYSDSAKGNLLATPAAFDASCEQVLQRRAAGEKLRPIDFLVPRIEEVALYMRDSGYLEMRLLDQRWCDPSAAKGASTLSGPNLTLRYWRRTRTTADGL